MEKLLRQIEEQLAAMTPEARAEVSGALRSIIAACLAMRGRGLKTSMGATGKAISHLMTLSASHSMPEILEHVRELSRGVGPHVVALFHAL